MKYSLSNHAEERKRLFFTLIEKEKAGEYDDDFLLRLIDYQRLCPESEHFDIFYARYAIAHGSYEVALEHALKAYKIRSLSFEICNLLIRCYEALRQPEKALPFQGYVCKMYTREFHVTLPPKVFDAHAGEFGLSMGVGNYAPFCIEKISVRDGALKGRHGVFGGEFIPVPADGENYAYWVGAHCEQSGLGARGKLLAREMTQNEFFDTCGAGFTFDIVRSKVSNEIVIEPEEAQVILPIASAQNNQTVKFESEDTSGDAVVGKWEYSFFRVHQKTRIHADHPLAFGKPIRLGHSKKRKKFVLNILADALAWTALKQNGHRLMPNTLEFFSRGIIFTQHFSVSEYTYPSLATIETGMYPNHSHIFNERIACQLERGYKTISEQMNELGYYCVNIMGGGDAVYNGATRGYDRLLVSSYDLSCSEGVNRTVQHLEAFEDCDQFLFLHFMDCHPWPAAGAHVPIGTQAKLSLNDRLNGAIINQKSVYIPNFPLYQLSNEQAIMHVDRNLKMLFDFITSHYDDDEYVVQFYSDHGTSVYDAHPYLLNDNQVGAVYMLRGSGVPTLGRVDELTSSIDIYPVQAKLTGFSTGEWVDGNLPKVFGGKEREYVISNSIYPGQTYKMCIRTKEHEFLLTSAEPVDDDGTVDLSGAEATIYMRHGERQEVRDDALRDYFYGLARKFTSSFDHEGCQWPAMREARLDWYGDA
ncbi:MAG: sulfatase-like hydrolase/transferase [Schwartzia sp.]|nr:sulfatase-like hydrolase/transferase [Schwartzia sp. (in: firmicutes)]